MRKYAPTDLIALDPVWCYSDFEQKAYQMSAEFQRRQIQAVAVWLEDGAKLACTLLAAWHAKVRVFFPPNVTQESVAWVSAHADLWLTDVEIHSSLAVYFDDFGAQQSCQKHAENRPLFDYDNQTEIWLKTSGSTGEAKTIIKTAEQMWLGAEVLAEALPFKAENNVTAISTVSIQHIYGLTVHIMMSLVNGWQIGRKQQFYPECMLAETRNTEQTVIVSSPAMLTRIDWFNTTMPKNIVGVISSGGALPEETSEQMRHLLQQPVIEIYGSTETGPIAIRDDIHLWQTLPNSRLGCNEDGALWIEGCWLSTREQTADVVEFLDGGFRLLGRSDRIVKIGDKRTSLAGIEAKLNQHAWVEDCYIAQHPEQPRLAAWVGLNAQGIEILRENGRRHLIDQLKAYLAETQDKTAIPRFWRFTDKLPRNSQSKINKLEFNRTCIEPKREPIWLTEQQTKRHYQATGKVPLDLLYLKDHFANFPLVPGAIELQWISDKIKALVAQDVEFSRLDKLKFQKFLRPNDCFSLELNVAEKRDKVTFQLKVENDMCCSGVAVLSYR
ncbi:AMP-binding protein [Aggregatibacter segnis]|nr:AMP-binding protein [Aggregatibacter segnis]QQB10076.1 AMP-binding protein [Aggregatibacter segnis]SQH64143.1 Surfactin synthase subunit 2 [Aggregatibacter segnis ATCC 33393]